MKNALGKGLSALIPDKGQTTLDLDIERIVPNPMQPRKSFSESALKELANSISVHGLIQPIIVERGGDGTFSIIAGERRWRAAAMAGLKKIPCIVKELSAGSSLMVAIVENIQREDLNPIETAHAYQRLSDEFQMKQEEIAASVGKDRATVANYMRLLKLPDRIKSMLNDKTITMGHAKALLSLDDEVVMSDIAARVVSGGLNVRDTERLCKRPLHKEPVSPPDPFIISIEEEMINLFGAGVRITNNNGKGKIEIRYDSIEELNRVIDMLRSAC